MIRIIGFLLVVTATFLLSWQMLNERMPAWEAESRYLLEAAAEAGTDTTIWAALSERADQNLPGMYPFSVVHDLLEEGETITQSVKELELSLAVDWDANRVPTAQLEPAWELLNQLDKSLDRVVSRVSSLPRWVMSDGQKITRDKELAQLEIWQRQLRDLTRLERVWRDFQKRDERVLILLQNRNEPRSTGGFVGSLVLLDFSEDFLTWQFLDIYELDRLLAVDDQLAAPNWFHDLSQTISLRDANFWPDFRTSAQQYRQMFEDIGQKPPRTIVGINLSVIETLLSFTGPVTIDPWGVTLDEYNFDLVLQFLVESKISGRFAVKQPILQFAQKLLLPSQLANVDLGAIRMFDWEQFMAEKHVLLHSQNIQLQKLAEAWNLDGQVRRKLESDNFLQFDFVSIGANKSDKFVWTKLWHDSEVDKTGRVKNTLQIRRTHALQPGEIDDILGTNAWTQNVRELFGPDLRWKLGAGENRIMLRVMVPVEAKLLGQKNPSGPITSSLSKDKKFKIWQIPLNVVPGETIEAELEYETQIARGSQRWRPYFLQMVGTPARSKTSLIKTISTGPNGSFSAQTRNIGRPTSLIDQDFRSVIEFN